MNKSYPSLYSFLNNYSCSVVKLLLPSAKVLSLPSSLLQYATVDRLSAQFSDCMGEESLLCNCCMVLNDYVTRKIII